MSEVSDFYSKSKADESRQQQITVDRSGNWQYPSTAEAGYVEIELPTLPGSLNPTERLHARDFGAHVATKVESAMQCSYLKSGPQQGPAATLKHYAAVARGASLMDEAALGRMETIAQDFERAPEQQEFFRQSILPYLHGLKPKRRQP